jgi:hypothetical protein
MTSSGLSDLCDRAGIASVLQAFADRLAFESSRRGASPGWDEAFRSVMHALQQVSDIEG